MRFRNPLFTNIFCLSFFVAAFLIVCAQQKTIDYSAQWKKIDDFINKGLTKSALTEVDKIYYSAKKNINDPQIIKSLLYKITLNENIEDRCCFKKY